MQIVYKAENIAEAQIVKGMLESKGIAAHVGGYYLQGGVGELPVNFANVQVGEEDYDQAREIIGDYESAASTPSRKSASPLIMESSFASRLVVTVIAALLTVFLIYLIGAWN